MSTSYRPSQPIRLENLLSGLLKHNNVARQDEYESGINAFTVNFYQAMDDHRVCLSGTMNGESNFLHYGMDGQDGQTIVSFERYGSNKVDGIIEVISLQCGVDIYNEHQDEYYEDDDEDYNEEEDV